MDSTRCDTVCNACRQTARDVRKRANRWLPKCRKTINNHADKFVQQGAVSSRSEFVDAGTIAAQ